MEMAWIILKQTLTMATYMAVGWCLFKCGKMTLEGSKTLATLLMWLIIPVVVIRAFCVEFSVHRLWMLLQSFALSAVALLISTNLSKLIFRQNAIDRFSAAFSNAGFIGIPLVSAALGEEAVFYLCGMLVFVNVMQWQWGERVIGGKKSRLSLKLFKTNPFILATLIGFVLFVTGLGTKLPEVLSGAMKGIADLNGPLAMLILGVYLAQTKMSTLFTTPRLYLISAVRLWLMPLVTVLVFSLFPIDNTVRMAVLISSSTAVGSNVAVYAQMHGGDYPYACKVVALSTLVSIIMMPLFIVVATAILGI